MHKLGLMIGLSLYALPVYSQPTMPPLETLLGFSFSATEPINPACIALFNDSVADSPYIKSINLSTCQHSNAAFKKTLFSADGGIYFYENDQDITDGAYYYNVLAKTKQGIYIIKSTIVGGGTLRADTLLFLRVENSKLYTNNNNKLEGTDIIEIKLLGYFIGGDRCTGGIKSINLKEHTLTVTQYAGDNPVDCDTTKNTILDLSALV